MRPPKLHGARRVPAGATTANPAARAYAGRAPVVRIGDGAAPVLALHGLGGSHRQIVELLGEEGVTSCTVFAPDQRFHGATPALDGDDHLTFDQLADDAAALVDTRVGAPVTVLGVSLGAGVAINLALRHARLVQRLLLVRPAWLDQPDPTNLAPRSEIAALLRLHGPAAAQARFEQSQIFTRVAAESSAAARALAAQCALPLARERVARLERLPASVPYREPERLAAVDCPTGIVAAPRDPLHPVSLATTLSRQLGAPLALAPTRYESPGEHAGFVARCLADTVRGP